MRITLLRHGIALPALPGSSDATRVLSDEGRAELKVVLEQAKAAGVRPTAILASPYRRAIQTAELAAEILGFQGAIIKDRALEPDRSPFDLWDQVRGRPGEDEVLLVGHQPLLGDLALLLLRRSLRIMPGTLVRIEIPDLTPEPKGNLLHRIEG